MKMDSCSSDRAGPVAVFVQPKLPRVKFHANKPGESYMPCNGTEGEFFHSMWCEECARDKAMNGTVYREGREETDEDWCEILGRSFREDAIPEWVYGADGQPCCTQFVPMEQEVTARCEHTADMFDAEQTASGCSHTARSDDQSKVDDQEPTTGSSHG